MNTHGHHDCAAGVGEPELKSSLSNVGKGSPRLTAFYLGNWLTDVSQAVDPVAYAAGAAKVDSFINGLKSMVDEIRSLSLYQTGLGLHVINDADVVAAMEKVKTQLSEAVHLLLLDAKNGRNSPLAQAMRSVFLAVGYFKFVHPEGPSTMGYKAFLEVFKQRYTQYYPHEHLDRPQILPADPLAAAVYADVVAGKTRSKNGNVSLSPDMYAYLRDDIEIAARLLAEVDYKWASKVFKPGQSVDDTTVDWNMNLAKLGHALHAVEDFFAHSNFIEHAALLLGEDFQPKKIKIFGKEIWLQKEEHEILARRLKKYSKPADAKTADWEKLPTEESVVTGYFDFTDTVISLSHILEEAFDLKSAGLGTQIVGAQEAIEESVKYPGAKWHEFQKSMTEALELLSNPRQAWKNEDNEVAKSLRQKYEPQYRTLTAPPVPAQVVNDMLAEPAFQGIPPEIKKAAMDGIVYLGKAHVGYKNVKSVYTAIKTLVEFMEGPVAWIKKFLVDAGLDWAKHLVIHYMEERALDAVGQKRIGCHSLLAKDHGGEWLYEHQKNCAKAVHWYVVHTLTRWARPQTAWVCKAMWDAKGSAQLNCIDQHHWLDWLELLEYFLRHPATLTETVQKTVTFCGTVVHVVRAEVEDSLENLAKQYAATAFQTEQHPLTWRRIADFNFATAYATEHEAKKIINRALKDTGLGYQVRPPNYAFKPGVRVLIPDQKVKMTVNVVTKEKETWYREIMKNKTWTVFKGWEDPKERKSHAPFEPHTIVWIKEDEMIQLVGGETMKRKAAENRYRV